MAKKNKREITIIYKFEENFNPHYANGAYGGVYDTGEIIMNFYTERMPLPNKQKIVVQEDQIDNISHEPENLQDSRLRFVHSGVIMSYHYAKELHRWLGEHLKKIEEQDSKDQ